MVNLAEMDREQLSALVDKYPWFAPARARLCLSTMEQSGEEAAYALLRRNLAWLPDGSYTARRMRDCVERDFTDDELAEAIRQVIKANSRPIVDGNDFFTRDEYASVRTDADSQIRGFARVSQGGDYPESVAGPDGSGESDNFGIISETLAEIYADQGYPDIAIEIYRQLSLQSPKKNAYFASLIENLQSANK